MKYSGRFVVPWTSTHYTAVVVMSLLSAPYVFIHCIPLEHKLGTLLVYVIAAVVIAFIPVMLSSALLTCAFIYGFRRKWTLRRLYGIAIVFASMLFVGFASMFSMSVVDTFLYFHPLGPDVARPMLCMNEIPLLVAAIIAGLMAARVCIRTIQREHNKNDAQLSAATGAGESAPAGRAS